MRLQSLLLMAVLGLLAGCPGEPAVEGFGGPTMGSTYSIKYQPGRGTPPTAELQFDVQALFAELDSQISTYRPDSDLARFNALPAGSCQALPTIALELLAASAELAAESGGALDPTLEPLLRLWGFAGEPSGALPTAEQIEQARADTGLDKLELRDGQVCKKAALSLNFNSIAAGYAVDRVSELLLDKGVENFLVEITGELRARGHKPDGSPWRIAIEAPREDQRQAQRVLALDGLAVSTSGDYRQYFEQNGRRYSHTLDPRSGAPVEHNLAAVTVVDPSALRADGLSTVLMVLGPERGLAFAEEQGIAALFVSRAGEAFDVRPSTAFGKRFGEATGPETGEEIQP